MFDVEHHKTFFGPVCVLSIKQTLIHDFSEIICVDIIIHTNKYKHPLLTKSGGDTHYKMLMILCAFLLRERARVLCW